MSTRSQSFDPVWDELFQKQAWGQYPSEHVIRAVARGFYNAPHRKAVRLLDLGAGPGACTWYMAREGFSVSAIDASPTAIDLLRKRLELENLAVDAKVGDFVSLPWDDDTFDGVIDNAALCCNSFANSKLVVSEVARVLKPGGLFCSANFSDATWGYGLGKRHEPGGFSGITEGPLAGRGFCLFMSRSQVDELYGPFVDVAIERISWTMEELTKTVDLWVVNCRKPG